MARLFVRPSVLLCGVFVLLAGGGSPSARAQEPSETAARQRADALFEKGDSLRNAYQLASAMEVYQRARALYQQVGAEGETADVDNEIGILHARQDNYERAETHLRRAVETYRSIGDMEGVAKLLNNVAIVQRRQGEYEEALDSYREVLTVYDEVGAPADRGFVLNNLGLVHEDLGQYSEALRRFKEGRALHEAADNREGVAKSQHNSADIMLRQGRYEEALVRFREALDWYRAQDESSEVASTLDGIGTVYLRREQYEAALSRYREALEVRREHENLSAVAETLGNIGSAYRRQERYRAAAGVLRQALRTNREIGDQASAAQDLNKLAALYRDQDSTERALGLYRDALRINRELGRSADVAASLYGLGLTHLAAARYAVADSVLRESIAITERLLETASGANRRDYLATVIDRFHALVTVRVRADRPRAALRVLERSRTRVLTEYLAEDERLGGAVPAFPSVDALQNTLGSREAAVLYANSDDRLPLTVFVVTNGAVQAREISDAAFAAWFDTRFDDALSRLRQREGTLLEQAKGVPNDDVLTRVVRLYRHDLSVPPGRQVLSSPRLDNLAQELYALLVAPLEDALGGRTNLLIVPDGALAYVPFETLRDRTGEYLVERWQVQYSQSLRTHYFLEQRAARSSEPRGKNDLLALGGAVYKPDTYAADTAAAVSGGAFYADFNPPASPSAARDARVSPDVLRMETEGSIPEGEATTRSYQRLGFGPDRWRNLGGTLREVRALDQIAGSSTMLLGEQASEQTIRQLSRAGELDDYDAVHFATHGFVVPEAPVLSALVLSEVGFLRRTQTGRQPSKRGAGASAASASADGYLNMREIADLDLNAEFVALSACETGLGRIYRGSGSVSLAQAFLRAGAGSVAVSLWPVYDASTSRFMQAVYRRAWGRDTTWLDAIAQTKRAFIAGAHGERLRAPRFWAPFVYYGQEHR